MAIFTLAVFQLSILFCVLDKSDASLRAHGINNETAVFDDADAAFGPGVGYEGLVGVLYSGIPHDGCTPMIPPSRSSDSNTTSLHFVLIERGKCDFALKVMHAQEAGYQAVIVCNINSDDLIHMSSGLPEIANKIDIPSVFVGQDTGTILNQSYLYSGTGVPYIELIESRFNPIDAYLIPFVVVIGVCFFSLLCFLLVRCCRDYRHARRGRLSLQRLKKLPVKKFKKEDEYDVCAICLEDYVEEDLLRILPCQHAYHCNCVDPWLTSSKRICPLCKRRVLSDDETTASSDNAADSSDDEHTPLVQPSDAASPNASRYGTGYTLRNPFRNRGRFFRRRISESSDETTNTDTSDAEPSPDSLTARSASRYLSNAANTSSHYQSQELSPAHARDAEISGTTSTNSSQTNRYLVSAENMLNRRSRVSESSIAVLSDEESDDGSREPCSSVDYHTVNESIATARTPYNLESRMDIDGSSPEDIIVIAPGSRPNVPEYEEV